MEQSSTYEICNIEYDNTLNKRLNSRIFPSANLQPNFDMRPVSTKYTKFLVDSTTLQNQSNENKMQYKYFNPHSMMYTGNAKAPVHYALDNVDVESKLQNRFFALQKNDQATYIPNLNSQLYKHDSNVQNKPKNQYTDVVYSFNPDPCNLAPNTFNNSTRYNLKNI